MALPAGQEFDFDAFSPAERRRSEQQKTVELKKLTPREKTKEEIKAEKKAVAVRLTRTVIAGVVLSALCFMNIYGYCSCDAADRKYSDLSEKYEMVQSDNSRLSMELNGMVSLEQIEKIAVEKLGLVKLGAGDIEYVKIAKENKVIVSSGEETN